MKNWKQKSPLKFFQACPACVSVSLCAANAMFFNAVKMQKNQPRFHCEQHL
jgi:hypothetical protein